MISVVIPVFNGEKYIERSVLSVLNQTFKNIELICEAIKNIDGSLHRLD